MKRAKTIGSLIQCLIFIICSTSCTATKQVTIQFTTEEGRIFIPVKINGLTYDFLFDTGASGIGRIDSSLTSELNLPIVGQSNNSDGINVSKIDNVEVKYLECGNIKLESPLLLSRNYNRGRTDGKFIYGIIGRDFWKDFTLTIDYEEKVITFDKKPLKVVNANTVRYHGELEIPIQIGDFRTTANIDTGSTVIMHIPKSVKRSFNTTELKKAGTGRRANTEFQFWKAQLQDELRFAGTTLKDVETLFSNNATHINIGSGLLKSFKISIDQRNKLIAFEKK